MIRYVLALALAVTVVGMSTTALDQVAADRGEQAVESEVRTLEATAVTLYENEALDPASDGPRRFVELDLPADRFTVDAAERLRIEPVDGYAGATATYSVEGRANTTEALAVPIRHADGGALELGGRTGSVRLVLRLVSDPQWGRVVEVATV